MTNKETINRNLGLTFDFVKYLIENPKLINDLPAKFNLEFVEKDFAKKIKLNKKDNIKTNKFVRVKNSFEVITRGMLSADK